MRPPEPFVSGREVAAAELVDRTQELSELTAVMRGGGRHFLIGPRRFGKTSLLTVAAGRVRELGDVVVQVNAERFATESAVATELVRQATTQFGPTFKRTLADATAAFSRLRPQFSYDAIKEAWSVKLTIDAPETRATIIAEALDGLDELARVRDRRIAVLLDEFPALVRPGGIVAERQLRAVVQTHRHLSYVFAGSDESMMIAMTSDHARPFYRLGSRRFLGPIPRDDFRDHISEAFRRSGIDILPAAGEEILSLAEDVPYSVQRLSKLCWQAARAITRPLPIDTDFVGERLDDFLRVEAPIYAQFLSQLTPNQLLVLKDLADGIARGGESKQARARRLGLGASTLQRSEEALVKKSFTRRVYDGDPKIRYAFEDPFFRRFVQSEVVLQ